MVEVTAMALRTVPPSNSCKSGGGSALDPQSFTRILAVENVPESGLHIDLCASEVERAALAETDGLAAVRAFETSFHVRKLDPARFKVTGKLRAHVTQICVVSLEPFETLVEADIDVDFAPVGQVAGAKFASGGDVAGACHREEDLPDPIIDGKIDLGALAAEFLVLNLDIYPRKPGVSFDAPDTRADASEENSPFAVLRHRSEI
jgi:hypothetical protein